MTGTVWIQLVGFILTLAGAAFGCYVGMRVAVTALEGSLRRIETLLTAEIKRIDDAINLGSAQRNEHDRRLRYLEEKQMNAGH